jgi:hypothetical protein
LKAANGHFFSRSRCPGPVSAVPSNIISWLHSWSFAAVFLAACFTFPSCHLLFGCFFSCFHGVECSSQSPRPTSLVDPIGSDSTFPRATVFALCGFWKCSLPFSTLLYSTAPFQHEELRSSSTIPGFVFGSSCRCFQRSHRLHYVEISGLEVLLAGVSSAVSGPKPTLHSRNPESAFSLLKLTVSTVQLSVRALMAEFILRLFQSLHFHTPRSCSLKLCWHIPVRFWMTANRLDFVAVSCTAPGRQGLSLQDTGGQTNFSCAQVTRLGGIKLLLITTVATSGGTRSSWQSLGCSSILLPSLLTSSALTSGSSGERLRRSARLGQRRTMVQHRPRKRRPRRRRPQKRLRNILVRRMMIRKMKPRLTTMVYLVPWAGSTWTTKVGVAVPYGRQ